MFAFGVGLSCVLLSFSLFQTLRASEKEKREKEKRIGYEMENSRKPLLSNGAPISNGSLDRLDEHNRLPSFDLEEVLDKEISVVDPTHIVGERSIMETLRAFSNSLKFW